MSMAILEKVDEKAVIFHKNQKPSDFVEKQKKSKK